MLNKYDIRQINRHNSHHGLWYGPDPEPNEPGPDCECAGCSAKYRGNVPNGPEEV